MKKKKVLTLVCAAVVAMSLAACGSAKTEDLNNAANTQTEETSQTEAPQTESTQEETASETDTADTTGGYEFTTDLLYNDADELISYVPYKPTSSSYAEAMMQVTGYDYKFIPDGTNYSLEVTYECGTPGADTTMYLKRTFTFTGTCTADGDVYTLDAPEHFTMTQETAGQFAATSGEGGADYWGPNGLTIDETFINDEGYTGVNKGADILAGFAPCTATVDGDAVSFEAIEDAQAADTEATVEGAEAAGTEATVEGTETAPATEATAQ